ncbi:BREX-1 system adenine-specific DNA-methyltransferase PglX [bacterium]|nr:BREX-1 system adenine-specific DNA-methyltransferase PglX [bacterium]
MPTLSKELRNQLSKVTLAARDAAEAACRAALENLAVHEKDYRGHMSIEQRQLRNRLRARGRALGDTRDERSGAQGITHLAQDAAFEHWHRMLFTRFLTENGLLHTDESQGNVPVTLQDCEELAPELGARDGFDLACRFASQTLPGVFRTDDPVFEIHLAPNDEVELCRLLDSLPSDVFTASDSLGWTYQFWQTEQKETVNKSGNKIGADELPSVTQLFTEDYMVDFLLDNTLGAWHAGKVLAANPELAETAQSEDELRQAVALPGCPWSYLRFIKGTDGNLTPAAGTFDGWPKAAAALRALDPCMGSGHFVVAMFERLVALRLAEEKLEAAAAVAAVIRDNLFGLEIDPRCTQIGAFNLATCFVERCLSFCSRGGNACLVTPQTWLFLSDYTNIRKLLLEQFVWRVVIRMGEHSFESASAAGAFAAMAVLENSVPTDAQEMATIDVSALRGQPPIYPAEKATLLSQKPPILIPQAGQIRNPDSRIVFALLARGKLLQAFVDTAQGIKTGDDEKWRRTFWELPELLDGWKWYQTSVKKPLLFGGASQVIDWRTGGAGMVRPRLGNTVQGRPGVAISPMGPLPAALYLGERFESSIAPLVPKKIAHLTAMWAFAESDIYKKAVRAIDQKLCVTTDTLAKVPFDLAHWQKVAAEKYPHGLPKPFSSDPTQWLFNGHPAGADQPLHVAVARLLDYQWPRQTGSSFPDCPALVPDGLTQLADDDGIVCLPPLNREQPAANRLRELLVKALGKLDERALIASAGPKGSKSTTLEDWLRDEFFEQHCALFHKRPFIWHIWDGHKDGFAALVNYHQLDHANLQKLTYSYLGDWINQQEADAKVEKPGADARLGAAQVLQAELAKILEGEAPYDIFVRWKPLFKQAIGWHPDLNDGVRMNIRPFIVAKDVGKKGAGLFRTKPGTSLKWTKDRGKEPQRDKTEYPWFWCEEEPDTDPTPGKTFTGHRWNNVHLTLEMKRGAKE